MFVDFVLNGQGHGMVGEQLGQVRYDPGMLRPYFNRYNERCVTVNTGRFVTDNKTGRMEAVYQEVKIADLMARGIYSPVFNATSLRKEDWIQLDKKVVLAARQRLRLWGALSSRVPYGGFNGMSKMTLEYEAMSDPGRAHVDFDGLTAGSNDAPLWSLRSLPLPIIHADFNISARKLAISRSGGTPIDASMGEASGRRVGEMVEQLALGTETGPTYGTVSTGPTAHTGASVVQGLTNFTYRLTKTNMTVPTGSNPEVTVNEVLAAREQLYTAKYYGPYTIFHSTDWDQYLDNDYARLGGSNANMTLRDRIRKIDGIEDVQRLDFLTSTFTMVFVQITSDVIEAVNGMDIQTVQWETVGGMQLNFKVMCIQVPRLKFDYNSNTGILHATTA